MLMLDSSCTQHSTTHPSEELLSQQTDTFSKHFPFQNPTYSTTETKENGGCRGVPTSLQTLKHRGWS